MIDNFFDCIKSDVFEQKFTSLINELQRKSPFGFQFFPLFNNISESFVNGHFSSFVLKNGIYELSMDVEPTSNADNVEINLDKNNVISIKYSVKTENRETVICVKEPLPSDANTETLDAEITGSKLIIKAEQKKENQKQIKVLIDK